MHITLSTPTFLLLTLPLLTFAQTYKASITEYGSNDERNSGNCNVKTTACGFYTQPGYSAAVSQNLFGVGDGQGAGPGCKQCWRLTGHTDSSGHKLRHPKTIIVMVNNLCPADSNVLCSMRTTHDRNQYGGQVNFDLCKNSGAAKAFLDPSGVGLAVGTATRVSCKLWHGQNHYGKVPRRGLGPGLEEREDGFVERNAEIVAREEELVEREILEGIQTREAEAETEESADAEVLEEIVPREILEGEVE